MWLLGRVRRFHDQPASYRVESELYDYLNPAPIRPCQAYCRVCTVVSTSHPVDVCFFATEDAGFWISYLARSPISRWLRHSSSYFNREYIGLPKQCLLIREEWKYTKNNSLQNTGRATPRPSSALDPEWMSQVTALVSHSTGLGA